MKKVLTLIALAVVLCTTSASAQSGYEEGSYYNTRGYVESYCGDMFTVTKYSEYYGYYNEFYQDCYTAQWHSASGGAYVMVWSQYGWQQQWYSNTYWWYTWQVRRIKVI